MDHSRNSNFIVTVKTEQIDLQGLNDDIFSIYAVNNIVFNVMSMLMHFQIKYMYKQR